MAIFGTMQVGKPLGALRSLFQSKRFRLDGGANKFTHSEFFPTGGIENRLRQVQVKKPKGGHGPDSVRGFVKPCAKSLLRFPTRSRISSSPGGSDSFSAPEPRESSPGRSHSRDFRISSTDCPENGANRCGSGQAIVISAFSTG